MSHFAGSESDAELVRSRRGSNLVYTDGLRPFAEGRPRRWGIHLKREWKQNPSSPARTAAGKLYDSADSAGGAFCHASTWRGWDFRCGFRTSMAWPLIVCPGRAFIASATSSAVR